MAARQGCSLQRFQRETTSSEFVDWCLFYELHWHKRFEPLFFYLAQIAMEVVRPNLKPGAHLTLDDFMFKFEEPKPISKEFELARSKAYWGAVASTKPQSDNKPKVRQAPSEAERKRMQEEVRKQWPQPPK